MPAVARILAREILDSRGNPTVEVDVVTDSGILGRAAVPSGASTGSREARELRDAEERRFAGKGVRKAIANVHGPIAERICGMDICDLAAIDRALVELDGTPDRSRLGSNAILAVSLAAARASAAVQGKELFELFGEEPLMPCPFVNVINGGAHADNDLDFQEFMIVPGGFPTFPEAIEAACTTFHRLKELLRRAGRPTAVGDEGGFAGPFRSVEEALEMLLAAIEKAGFRPGDQMALALDVAATGLRDGQKYRLARAGVECTGEELVARYEKLCEAYPIVSIEDGMAEDDREGWKRLTDRLGKRVQLVGDDVFVTQAEMLRKGIADGIATAVLVKPNQVGTLSETLETVRLGRENGYGVMVSHRSGETEDVTIAHLAVGTAVGMIKTGSVSRGERTAKYNELLRIQESIGSAARFAGFSSLSKSQ